MTDMQSSESLPAAIVDSIEPNDEVMAPLPDAQSDEIWAHSFLLGDIGLLLTADVVSEVIDQLPHCRLPNSPAWLRGMANHHGNIVPIFDLEQILGVRLTGKRRRLLVVGQKDTKGTAVAMTIDALPERITLKPDSETDEYPPVPDRLKPFIKACYEKDGTRWIDWNVTEFFASVAEEL